MILPGFVGNAYQARSLNADAETLYNWYVESIQSATGKSPAAQWFVPTPGLHAFTENLDGPPRGALAQDGRVFFVAGRYLYELNGVGTATSRGYVGTDDQPASLASNGHGGHQLLVISAGSGWIFDLDANSLTQITAAGFPTNAVMCDFLAGYFIVMQAGTSKFFLSDLFDGLLWDATMVGQTTYSSDTLKAIKVLKGNLWLIGSQRTEVWWNAGGVFPLTPIPGAFSEYGTGSPWSVIEAFDKLWMIGQNARGNALVLASEGVYFSTEVSTYAVSLSLSRSTDLQSAIGSTYQQEGHTFIRFTLPKTGPTWSYDTKETQWHQEGEYSPGLDRFLSSRWTCHAYGFDKHLVGDHTLGTIYEMSVDYTTDNGTRIVRERTMPHVNEQRQWLFWHQVWVDLQAGVGTATDPDPVILWDWSNDGGHTFGPARTLPVGAIGARQTRAITHMLGRSQDRVNRLRVSSAVPYYLLNAYGRISAGTGLS